MKVFDFSTGTKGKELDDIKLVQSMGASVVVKNGQRYKISVAGHGDKDHNWSWHTDADNGLKEIKPEDYGVGAICFCAGEWFHTWYPGHPEAQSAWEWVVIGSPEWNRQACHLGFLKSQHIGAAFAPEVEGV